MTVAKVIYTRHSTTQPYSGPCSKCQTPIVGTSYGLAIDFWYDGVLRSARFLKKHENLCQPCFDPFKLAFQHKNEL